MRKSEAKILAEKKKEQILDQRELAKKVDQFKETLQSEKTFNELLSRRFNIVQKVPYYRKMTQEQSPLVKLKSRGYENYRYPDWAQIYHRSQTRVEMMAPEMQEEK